MAYFNNIREEMMEFVPVSCKNTLEIGCSEGRFSTLIKERNNAEVWGVEMNSDASLVAEKVLHKVINKDFFAALPLLPLNYFDCIIFNDVLEHFTEPLDVLKEVKKHLNPEGVIVSSIPNVRFVGNLVDLLIKKDWEYKEEGGILDATHYRFFTKKSIIRLYNQAGFEVVKIKGINPTGSIKVKLLNLLTFGFTNDIQYLEFASVAKVNTRP